MFLDIFRRFKLDIKNVLKNSVFLRKTQDSLQMFMILWDFSNLDVLINIKTMHFTSETCIFVYSDNLEHRICN